MIDWILRLIRPNKKDNDEEEFILDDMYIVPELPTITVDEEFDEFLEWGHNKEMDRKKNNVVD